jgi:hypothetical protein
MNERWKKIVAERACDVIDAKKLSSNASELLTEVIGPEEFIRALAKAGQWLDAVKVLAYALPKREAVWWACVCARGMQGVLGDKAQQLALATAEKWVFEPTDEQRTAAFLAMQKCKSNSGGSLSALSAAFSAESLPLGGGQKLEVDLSTFPEVVFATVFLAANESGEVALNDRLQDLLSIGEDIARGGSGKKEEQPQ